MFKGLVLVFLLSKFPENLTSTKNTNTLFAGPGGFRWRNILVKPFSFRQTNILCRAVNGFCLPKFPYYPVHKLDLYALANMLRRPSPCRYLAGITFTSCSLPILPLALETGQWSLRKTDKTVLLSITLLFCLQFLVLDM